MPLVQVDTNLGDREIPADFGENFTNIIADILNKPKERISVTVHSNLNMYFKGSSNACAVVRISSIGVFDEERNKAYGTPILNFLNAALGLPDDRITLALFPLEAYNVASRV